MRDILVTPEELQRQEAQMAQAQQAAQQMPGAMEAAAPQATQAEAPVDMPMTGAMPPGLEPPPLPLEVGGAGARIPNLLRGQ